MHLPFSTLPLWNISAPAATFLATCVASEVSEGAALLTGVAAAAAAYQNEEVVSPIETARKRMIIVAAAAAALLLFWPVSFPERFFFAN